MTGTDPEHPEDDLPAPVMRCLGILGITEGLLEDPAVQPGMLLPLVTDPDGRTLVTASRQGPAVLGEVATDLSVQLAADVVLAGRDGRHRRLQEALLAVADGLASSTDPQLKALGARVATAVAVVADRYPLPGD